MNAARRKSIFLFSKYNEKKNVRNLLTITKKKITLCMATVERDVGQQKKRILYAKPAPQYIFPLFDTSSASYIYDNYVYLYIRKTRIIIDRKRGYREGEVLVFRNREPSQ